MATNDKGTMTGPPNAGPTPNLSAPVANKYGVQVSRPIPPRTHATKTHAPKSAGKRGKR
jgi:hypothetical protein